MNIIVLNLFFGLISLPNHPINQRENINVFFKKYDLKKYEDID